MAKKKWFYLDGKRDPARVNAINTGRIDIVLPDGTVQTLKPYRKTTVTWATQMPIDFKVDTLEGEHTAHAGDYLAVGSAHGEMYPVAQDIFEHMYEEVTDDDE